jgi:hypothetical protein
MYPAPGVPCIPPEVEPELLPELLPMPEPLPLVAPLDEPWPPLLADPPELPDPELPLPFELPPLPLDPLPLPLDPLPPGPMFSHDVVPEHAVNSRHTIQQRTIESLPTSAPVWSHGVSNTRANHPGELDTRA